MGSGRNHWEVRGSPGKIPHSKRGCLRGRVASREGGSIDPGEGAEAVEQGLGSWLCHTVGV